MAFPIKRHTISCSHGMVSSNRNEGVNRILTKVYKLNPR